MGNTNTLVNGAGSYSVCFEEPWASLGRNENPRDSPRGGEAQQTEPQAFLSLPGWNQTVMFKVCGDSLSSVSLKEEDSEAKIIFENPWYERTKSRL